MVIANPCGICNKSVGDNHRSIQCDVCNCWIHIRCNNISPSLYEELIHDEDPWICIKCINYELTFSQYDNKLYYLNKQGIQTQSNLENIDLTINPNDKKLIKYITNLIIESTDPENVNNKFCNYYDVEKFTKSKLKSDQNFSVLHLNIASLQFHFEELKLLLQLLNYSFDIIAISESKLQKGINPVKDINLPNYQYLHTPTETTKGGTLLYISDKLIFKPRNDLEIYQSKDIESTFTEIIMPKGKNIIVGCVYRHHTIDQSEFTKIISPLLEKLKKEKKPTYITGDFNINLLNIEKDKHIEEYFEQLTDNNFMPLITLPTRITSSSKTLIDNILYNQFVPGIISENLTVNISDHIPQFSIIPLSNKIFLPKNNDIYVHDYKKINHTELINNLNAINWDYDNSTNVNEDASHFLQKTNDIIEKLAPARKITNKEYKLKSKPWITPQIVKQTKKRDQMYKRLMKSNNQIVKNDLKSRLRHLKNEIKNELRSSKKDYLNKYFTENSQNSKKLWKGINEIISSKTKSQNSINCLEVKNEEYINNITNPQEISNIAVDYFTNVAEEILKKRKYNGNKHFTDYLKNANPSSFFIKPTDPKEIESIINQLNTSKSVGPNSIPPKLIKQISHIISNPLANIFNKSFKTNVVPNLIKLSRIITLHKKDSKLKISNYRPISILSNINKILEKLMFKRLYEFLEEHRCIYELQFGFRANHSTNHAILSITQKIQEAINNDNIAIGIFIDLQKAFDTVNHEILLRKLDHYGVRGLANKWFESYLTNRKQFVDINGVNSKQTTIKHGVPQGSVLGPLLFLIYINDLHKCIHHSNTFHFADDTHLLHIPKKTNRKQTEKEKKNSRRNIVRKLNQDLKSLNNWLIANKISLNATKTELIIFRGKNKSRPNVKIKLNGTKLIPKSEIKYLGLIFDEHLTFHKHIKVMNTRLKRANNLLAISRHYLHPHLLKQIYYGQFHSIISYGCQVWGYNQNSTNSTYILQKKALRLITFSNKQANSDPIFKQLKINKLKDIITSNDILFVHNTLNGKSPIYFKNYFEKVENTHNFNTRRNPSSTHSIPPGSVSINANASNTLQKKCAEEWNKILKILTNADHPTEWLVKIPISKLKSILKQHFIDTY